MYEFLVIVAANFVAYLLIGVIGITLAFSKPVIKWVTKKSLDVTKICEEEFEKMVEEDEL